MLYIILNHNIIEGVMLSVNDEIIFNLYGIRLMAMLDDDIQGKESKIQQFLLKSLIIHE